MAAATDKTFLALPPPPTTYDDDPRGNISVEEQKMYNEVLAHFTKTDPVYTIPHVEKGAELMDEEKFWLSRDCLLRYVARFSVRGQPEIEYGSFSILKDIYGLQSGKSM